MKDILKKLARRVLRQELDELNAENERLRAVAKIATSLQMSADMMPAAVFNTIVKMLPDPNKLVNDGVPMKELRQVWECNIFVQGRGNVTLRLNFVPWMEDPLVKYLRTEEGGKGLRVRIEPMHSELNIPLIKRSLYQNVGGILCTVDTWAWDLRNFTLMFDDTFGKIVDFLLSSMSVRNDLLGIS